MKATLLSCTLKTSPEPSNTEALASVVIKRLADHGVDTTSFRLVDLDFDHSIESDTGDDWTKVREAIVTSEILIFASPTWLGHPSSLAHKALERMDALISETTDDGVPIAFNRVAGVVVTGNEDGAHHVISEICGGLIDIGYTIPGQAWTYWNRGPGPGDDYSQTKEGHEWSHSTGRTMADNLVAVAQALHTKPLGANHE